MLLPLFRYAVSALMHLSSLSPADELTPDRPKADGNLTVERVRELLPYIRAAVQSPALLIATLHQQPSLRTLLQDELEWYTNTASTAAAMSHMQSPSSGASMADLVKRYRLLSDKYVDVSCCCSLLSPITFGGNHNQTHKTNDGATYGWLGMFAFLKVGPRQRRP
jgi:hypothetical protein